jgi:ribosomal protein L29
MDGPSLTAELADLKATLAELRIVLAAERSQPLDLSRLRAVN